MWRATLRGILAGKVRLALTALAIVLGVGFVTGTYVLGDTLNKTFDNLFANAFAGTDVVVQGAADISDTNRPPVPEGLLGRVRAVEGVAAAEGEVAGTAGLIAPDGDAVTTGGAPTLGFSWTTDPELNPFELFEGRAPAAPGEIVIDEDTADANGFAVGDRVRVILPEGVREFDLVGIAGFAGEGGLAGATTTLFTLPEAQRAFNLDGLLSAINVRGEEGVSPGELAARIQALLPAGIVAETAQDVQQQQADRIKDQLRIITISLLVFAFIAVFVAAFIIFNTFSITVAQRARQLALLRAIGASGGQVTRMVVAEALVVGVVASLAGLALGVLIALGLQAVFAGFGFELPSTALEFRMRTVVVSLVVGIGVTVVAAVAPALRAARLSPMAALREDVTVPERSARRRLVVGGLVTAGGAAVIALAFRGDGAEQVFAVLGAGTLLVFVGLAMLAPLIARPLAGALGAPLTRLGVPGRLGRENAMRNPQRTARTAAALMIGLALVTFVSIFAASLNTTIGASIERQFQADYIASTQNFTGFPPAAARAAAGQPDVARVAQVRVGEAAIAGSSRFVGGVDPAAIDGLYDPDFVAGGWGDLRDGGILVHEDRADDLDLAVGDAVEVRFARTGVQRLRVAGVFAEEVFAPFYITLSDYERNFTEQLDVALFAAGREGASPEAVREQLERAIAPYPGIQLRDQGEFKTEIQGQINQLLALIFVLLGLAIVIAIFGIVNTLALSIFERTREIGLLRALGLSPGQARAMVRWESVIVSLLGGVLGIALGLIFGAVLVSATPDIDALSVPVTQILIFFVLAGLAGVLAAIGPARRAARLDVLRAVAQE